MLQSEALKFTEGCFNGEPASCTYACPYHIDLRSFLKKAARGRWDSCYKDLINAVAFPYIACSICPKSCEASCQRVLLGDAPIAVNDIEKACIEYAKSKSPDIFTVAGKHQRVAVIGAGICGLTAAFFLSQKQFNVTVYDKSDSIGGSLKSHPDFPKFSEDISSKFISDRVVFELNHTIASLTELSDYDAILIATGANTDGFGLAATRSSKTYQTENSKVFACGELFGCAPYEALGEGIFVANLIEAYILSGSPDFGVKEWNTSNCTRFVEHSGAQSSPLTEKSGEIYTKDEAKKEAARCLQCDCKACLEVCEFMRKYKKKPTKLATEVYMDSQVRPPITTHSATKAVYACNLCGKCSDVCTENTDLPGLFCFSRQNRVERGDYPPAFHDFWIQSQKFFSEEAAFHFSPDDKPCEYAFFPGCQLGAADPQYVENSYAFLLENYSAGIISTCCGAPSYWGGDKELLDENTAKIRNAWEALGKPKLVTACLSCTKMLKLLLPEAETVSLYTLLDEKKVNCDLSEFETVSVFDPCSVSTTPDVKAAVRSTVQRSTAKISDYSSDGQCCGNGGHIKLADFALYSDITRNRAADSQYPYVVYCVNCREVFKAQGKSVKHILEAVFGFDAGNTPYLEEKKRNAVMAKIKLLDKYKNFKFIPSSKPWDDIMINVPDDVRIKMEDKMLTDSNVKETIWSCEQSGEGFYSPETDAYLGCLVKPALTYWVEYSKNGDGFDIRNVYCHRMHFRESE